MLYHRLNGLDPTGTVAAFEGAPRIKEAASARAKMLRVRASHCRELAETFYDQSIVAELEAFASELDAEAAILEAESRPRYA